MHPNFKAIILEPYSNTEEGEKEKEASGFIDLDVVETKKKPNELYKAYKVVDVNIHLNTEYSFTKGSIVLVDELAVNKFTWQGKIVYFVNSAQYVPIVLQE